MNQTNKTRLPRASKWNPARTASWFVALLLLLPGATAVLTGPQRATADQTTALDSPDPETVERTMARADGELAGRPAVAAARGRVGGSDVTVPLLPPQPRTAASKCDCSETLMDIASYVERNYAGFHDKATGTDRRRHDDLLTELRTRANQTSAEDECFGLLLEYSDFFQDPHLGVSRSTVGPPASHSDDAIRARFSDRPSRTITETEVVDYLDQMPANLNPIVGIWEMVGADHRLAILPDETVDDRYEAVTLSADGVWWVPGQIKATFEQTPDGEYRVDYYMRDHSHREETGRVRQGLLYFTGVSSWARVRPENTSGYDSARYRDREAGRDLGVLTLDSSTLLLRLPDFSPLLQAQIDSVIEANWDRLVSTSNLIIDVRGNPGGGNASYRSVQPLLYTGPVIMPGMSYRATDDNIRTIEGFLGANLTEDVRDAVQEIVSAMREHRGGFVPASDDTLSLDRVLPRPERVAVLADRWCVSSCESFVWAALQSDKVTVFGENTGGFLDYGDVLPVETSCSTFLLHSPTSRSNRIAQGIPLDNVGIAPDVRVPEGILYWVDWVREQLP